ncbi:hypothetical protein AKACHI_11050 [Aquiluna sp. KACHI24]|nr:hypothetical protein AKACHI_11050 [Aquiluna sp. KACHI24]
MHKRYTSFGLVVALVASLLTVLSIPLAANAAVTLPPPLLGLMPVFKRWLGCQVA